MEGELYLLKVLDMLEVMHCMLLCMLQAVKGGLCLREVGDVEVLEVMCCVPFLCARCLWRRAWRRGGRLVRGRFIGKVSLSDVVLVLLAVEAGAVKEGSEFLPKRVPSRRMPSRRVWSGLAPCPGGMPLLGLLHVPLVD